MQLSRGAATLTLGEAAQASAATVTFRNLSHFYLIHRCLTNSWSYVGNFEKASFEDTAKKVLVTSYSQPLDYSDFALRNAVEVQEQAAVGWVIRNDELTRSRMSHFQLGGLTPGVPCRAARPEHHSIGAESGDQQSQARSSRTRWTASQAYHQRPNGDNESVER